MPQDANGNEIAVGDVVTCQFRVTNIIADAEKLNLLCEHFKGHEGLPDDYRISLDSARVDVYSSPEAKRSHERGSKPGHEPAAGEKKHGSETHEPEGKPAHEQSAGDKKHGSETHEPEGKPAHALSAGDKKHAKD
jgi:hypothetical protein